MIIHFLNKLRHKYQYVANLSSGKRHLNLRKNHQITNFSYEYFPFAILSFKNLFAYFLKKNYINKNIGEKSNLVTKLTCPENFCDLISGQTTDQGLKINFFKFFSQNSGVSEIFIRIFSFLAHIDNLQID